MSKFYDEFEIKFPERDHLSFEVDISNFLQSRNCPSALPKSLTEN